MKIQCNVCEAAEAKVLCCADEAALCWECDEKVHAANKLASKHQRVPLSTSSSHMPKCDICQAAITVTITITTAITTSTTAFTTITLIITGPTTTIVTAISAVIVTTIITTIAAINVATATIITTPVIVAITTIDIIIITTITNLTTTITFYKIFYSSQEALGYFFCLEDRALLCRKCDVAIHTANAYVSGHQRFLLTGVRVGLEAIDPGASLTSLKSDSGEKVSDTKSSSVSRKVSTVPQPSNYNEVLPIEVGGVGEFPPAKVSFGGGSTDGNISQWTIDEFIGLNEFSQHYDYMEGSSRSSDSSFVRDCRLYGSAPSLMHTHTHTHIPEKGQVWGRSCLLRIPKFKKWNLTDWLIEVLVLGFFLSLIFFSLWLYDTVIFFFTSSFSDAYVQADGGKLGDSDSPVLKSGEEDMEEEDDYLERVPDSSWTVPQIPSPPTASGLCWPKDPQYSSDSVLFVPDISFSLIQQSQISSICLRRWRQL
ncbi:B-box zinc finger protein 22 [Glycine max]|nr:B-box zinc finger protein 22 [Glycine max]KAH1218282.1 B-box zinc finger protein 22 [Glycine max]